MNLPFFKTFDDPGPDFAALVRRAGLGPPLSAPPGGSAGGARVPDTGIGAGAGLAHATTCVAVRYTDGVLLAGDRRATAGNFIAHRALEKVFPADRYSGVAIAGAAGPAMEMVKLFQLQLEHYEKVEGSSLSLEGKANQLAMMVRNHLPAAMQGMAVVPLFAGYDLRRGAGRLFEYDVTGGRYEESNFAATGSGSLHAGTVIKIGFREGMARERVIDLSLEALFQAADEDSATGGPDLVRRIFPVMATITSQGFLRVGDDEIEERFRSLIDDLAERERTTVPRVPETTSEVAPEADGDQERTV